MNIAFGVWLGSVLTLDLYRTFLQSLTRLSCRFSGKYLLNSGHIKHHEGTTPEEIQTGPIN